MISPPVVYRDIIRASEFLDTLTKNAELVVLPFNWAPAVLHDGESIKKRIKDYQFGIKQYGNNDLSSYPTAISEVEINGKRRFLILLSECPNEGSEVEDELITVFRNDKISDFTKIINYGLFQIPGRLFVREGISQLITPPDTLTYSMQLRSDTLMTIHIDGPTDYDKDGHIEYAIGFDHPDIGAQLPDELNQTMYLYDGRNSINVSVEDVKSQILPGGCCWNASQSYTRIR